MKKIIQIIMLIIIFTSSAFLSFNLAKPRIKSKILVGQTKVEKKAENRYVVRIPMATLPKPDIKKEYEILEGKVIQIPNNESDSSSLKMVVLLSQASEKIVLTNILFVHTLELLYLEKEVKLKGSWRKNAVIFGKEYKTFWIEDIDLIKKKS